MPKCLGVCARLQATLLASTGPSGQVDPAEATDDIVALRKSALAEVEAFLRGIIDTLAENALRLEWRGGSTNDSAKRNGVGKAGEIVESMLSVVRGEPPLQFFVVGIAYSRIPPALLPETDTDFQASYPRTVRVLPSPATDRVGLRTPSKNAASEASLVASQSTLVINSPAEAISIVLSSLRILVPVIKTSAYLAEYRPATVDLLARCFPTEDSLVPSAGVAASSRKGKDREAPEALDALRDHILTGWIALACEMLDAPDAAGLFEVQVVARLILAELHSRVIDPLADHTMDVDAADLAPRAATEVEVWLLTALAKIWSLALRREAKGSGLQELLQYSLVILAEAVTSLIELDGFSHIPQSAQTLLISFAMCLPAALGWTSSDPDALNPDEFTSTFFASLHAVFARLTENENVGAAARDAIAAACGAARAAAVQIHSVDMVATSADETTDFDASPRKRRRVGEKEELIRPQVGADGQPTAEASRQHRDAVRRLVSQALAWARHEAEKDVPAAAASILAAAADDSAEHTMLRYIAALPSASPELGYHLARTIGLLSCAKNNCLALVAADDFSAPTPSCAVCDPDERSSTLNAQLGATRALTKEPLEALVRVFEAYLSSAKHEQGHLGALDMLRRLINHSAMDHPLMESSDSRILRMVKSDLEHGRRSIRSAAG